MKTLFAKLALAMCFTLFFGTALLTGCGSMQSIAAPQTMSQKIAYAKTSLASARDVATNLSIAGHLTLEQFKQIVDDTNTIEACLNTAASANTAGNQNTAVAQLQLAVNLLNTIQTQLLAKGATP